MKTYEILIDGRSANEYIQGRISGIIHALTGMPDKGYPWRTLDHIEWTTRFDATEEQYLTIQKELNKIYPKAFVGIREIG